MQMLEYSCNGIHEAAEYPAGIKGPVTYGNQLKALICVLNIKEMEGRSLPFFTIYNWYTSFDIVNIP